MEQLNKLDCSFYQQTGLQLFISKISTEFMDWWPIAKPTLYATSLMKIAQALLAQSCLLAKKQKLLGGTQKSVCFLCFYNNPLLSHHHLSFCVDSASLQNEHKL